MPFGKIIEYDACRGCGSVTDEESGQTLVFYANYLRLKKGETLIEGSQVRYDIEKNRQNRMPINIEIFQKNDRSQNVE